jgi:hypothetical protein
MDLSSTGSLYASLLVGSIGLGLFMYGRKLNRMPQVGVGASMMVYPYFVTGVVPMLSLCGLLLGGLWMLQRGGGQ